MRASYIFVTFWNTNSSSHTYMYVYAEFIYTYVCVIKVEHMCRVLICVILHLSSTYVHYVCYMCIILCTIIHLWTYVSSTLQLEYIAKIWYNSKSMSRALANNSCVMSFLWACVESTYSFTTTPKFVMYIFCHGTQYGWWNILCK